MRRRSEIGTRASWQVRPLRRQRSPKAAVDPVDCLRATGAAGSVVTPAARTSGPVAALDCGTNSTRLLVARADGTTETRLMRITRLGQGVDATGDLHPDAIERTLGVLREFRQVMDRAGVARGRLVTTSAVRDARNGDAFMRAASEAIGFPAELLSGQEEGRLAYAGATAGLPATEGDDLVVDIGGGSTELVTRRHGTVQAFSMDIGCVRLTERFLGHDPPDEGERSALVAYIDAAIEGAGRALPILSGLREPRRLLGVAGTITTLAALALGLPAYDSDRIHHSVLTREAVDQWCATLAAEPSAARAVRPGMVAGRADVIVGGAYILRQLMAHLAFDACIASESDILDGIALSLLA
jgi:exopolyphosphatase/guanosine-5'-triphosphate,3'-diphosphate pyrophosphatase